jgi:hypothetical protein
MSSRFFSASESFMSGKPATEQDWLNSVATLAEAYARAEMVLINVLRLVSGLERKRAKALYFAADAQPTRYKIIRAFGADRPDDQVALVNALIEASDRIGKKRNEFAHSFLRRPRNADDALERVYLRDQTQPHRPVTVAYIVQTLTPVKTDLDAMTKNFLKLSDLLGVPPELWIE